MKLWNGRRGAKPRAGCCRSPKNCYNTDSTRFDRARVRNRARDPVSYVGLQQRSTFTAFRILALVMIGFLLQTMFLAANCIAVPLHTLGNAVEGSKDCPGSTEGDAGCCSYCFCCHSAGVLNCADPSLSLVANGLLAPTCNPVPPQSSISPFDQPPRP